MKTKLMSFALVVLAFLPLWCLMIVQMSISVWRNRGGLYSEWIGIIILLSMIGLSVLIVGWSRKKQFYGSACVGDVINVREQKTVTVKFILENVLPLFVFDCRTFDGLISILVYFLLVGSLSVRHRHFQANIWLEWFGYTFYEGDLVGKEVISDTPSLKRKVVIVSEEDPSGNIFRQGENMRLYRVNNEVILAESERK